MGEAPIRYEVRDGVATVTLDRPGNANSLDAEMLDGLADAFLRLADERDLRVAVIRATGKTFCPGADLAWLRADIPGMAARIDRALERINPALASLRDLPAVIVAAVHGAVAGGGIGLMSSADLIIAAADTKFALAYSRLGATPDLGATWLLPRAVGERRALELMMLSESFDAHRAHDLGLVNFVVPSAQFADEVDRLIARLAQGPAAAYAAIKKLTYAAHYVALAAQLDAERRAIFAAASGREFGEGVQAYVDRRAPAFR